MASDNGPNPADWEYDVLQLAESGGVSLRHIAFTIFEEEGLVGKFGIPDERFKSLLQRLEDLYSVENPYHCALHAADVLAATHCLHKGLPSGVFDDVEVLALYLAAVGHDAGHFRLNNAFLKNAGHALYRTHKESALERFHLGLVFELLEDSEVGIVDFLGSDLDKRRFKDLVTTLILATDMARHSLLFQKARAFLGDRRDAFRAAEAETDWAMDSTDCDTGEAMTNSFDTCHPTHTDPTLTQGQSPTSNSTASGGTAATQTSLDGARHEPWVAFALAGACQSERELIAQLLLKCADLTNVVRPIQIADTWGKRIMEEFYQQGEKERTLGFPVTTFHNRKNFDYVFARHQSGFLVNVVRPLFDELASLLDFDTRTTVIGSCAENGSVWARRENENRPRGKKGDDNDVEKAKKAADAKGFETKGLELKGSAHTRGSRSSHNLNRQSTGGWTQTSYPKQSATLTMLTANAMEMKGLHFQLAEGYGANDDAAAAVRFLMPFIPRSELARLARCGLLVTTTPIGSANASPMRALGETASTSDTAVGDFANSAAARRTRDATKEHEKDTYAKLASRHTCVSAVVVATFDGFLELERRAAAEAETQIKALARGKNTKALAAKIRQRCANAFGNALSGVLAKAVDSVHACGGDVARMGHDGIVGVFPLSGGDTDTGVHVGSFPRRTEHKDTHAETEHHAGAVLRASRCAFTLVSQLSSLAPELSRITDAQAWPGLRTFSKGVRVMVVEALQLSRMSMGRLLDHFGCSTHFAENASQAAAACANMEFDVILMNVLLPIKDGYELARHVRAHGGPVNGRAYIAAVTYVQQPELLEQCVSAGMNEVIVKPATMGILRSMFRRARRRKRTMKQRDATQTRSPTLRKQELTIASNPYSLGGGHRASRTGTRASSAPKHEPTNCARDDESERVHDDDAGDFFEREREFSRSSNLAPHSKVMHDGKSHFGGDDTTRHHLGSTTRTNNCVPVHLPNFADMLISAGRGPGRGESSWYQLSVDSYASFDQSGSRDDGGVAASSSTKNRGKQTGAMHRFWRAMCGYDDSYSRGGDGWRAREMSALRERSSSLFAGIADRVRGESEVTENLGGKERRSVDDGSGSVDGVLMPESRSGFRKAGATLARYKSDRQGGSQNVADSTSFDTSDDDGDVSSDDDFETATDFELNQRAPLPVTIAVTAAVGFGYVSEMRVGTTCLGTLRERDGDGNGFRRAACSDRLETEFEKTESENAFVKRVLRGSDRDVLVHCDAVSWGNITKTSPVDAAAAAARNGGPFAQCARLIRTATAGDVVVSPTAWRLVSKNCEGDTPPGLRGGARLNRIRVHEVVPPLLNHALAPHTLAGLVPNAPDPHKALRALVSLVPSAVRNALAERVKGAAISLARDRDRRDAGMVSESDDDTETSDGEEKESDAEKKKDDGTDTDTDASGSAANTSRKLAMPVLTPSSVDVCVVCVYLPGPSSGATSRARVPLGGLSPQNTLTHATAAVTGLLERFQNGSLTRVCNDVLFGTDVDTKTGGGGGGGGDGVVLYVDFAFVAPALLRGAWATEDGGHGEERQREDYNFVSARVAATAATATAFALAARAAMEHLGFRSAAVGVASGRAVVLAAGATHRRCEWITAGDVVSRAQRLAAFADNEVLCDLAIVKQCAGTELIDFDPVPHAAFGNDAQRARNLRNGNLDRILCERASGARLFSGSSRMGRKELAERGSELGNGTAPGPCVLMPHGTRAEGFGDAATTKRRGSDLDESRDSFHEKESGDENSRPESNPDSTENAHTDALFSKNTHVVTTVIDDDLTTVGDTTELARASAATELAARDSCAAGKMSYAALAALSLASASAAVVLTLETLMRDSDDLNSSQNSGKQKPTDQPLALVGHERTLRLAKRVIREAQEHGAPRLLFLEGAPNAGKTRAANAVLDLPEARALWLLRTRGGHCVERTGHGVDGVVGGSRASITSSGSFLLASFTNLFHQLLGFTPRATSRERKAAVVELLEQCGTQEERLGRYAKPILEILGFEGASTGGELDDDDDVDSARAGSAVGRYTPDRHGSVQSDLENYHGPRRGNSAGASRGSSAQLREKTSEKTTYRGLTRGLSLEKESEDGSQRGAAADDVALCDKETPKRNASRNTSLANGERSAGNARRDGADGGGSRRDARARGGFPDAVSRFAAEDAARYLSKDAVALLVGDGLRGSNLVDFGEDAVVSRDGRGGKNRDDHHGKRDDDRDDDRRGRVSSDDDDDDDVTDTGNVLFSPKQTARAVVIGALAGSVAFARQRNGVQRRDHNKRFHGGLHRTKNTLATLLVSEGGIGKLCATLALMLERLLLGRSTQTSPGSPSQAGWLLLVEDAQWLDPFSAGVIRALLDKASIPLVILMTRQRRVQQDVRTQNELSNELNSSGSANVSTNSGSGSVSPTGTTQPSHQTRERHRLSTVDETGRDGDVDDATRSFTRQTSSEASSSESDKHAGSRSSSSPGPGPENGDPQVFDDDCLLIQANSPPLPPPPGANFSGDNRDDNPSSGNGNRFPSKTSPLDVGTLLRNDLSWMRALGTTVVVDVFFLSRAETAVFVESCVWRALHGASSSSEETRSGERDADVAGGNLGLPLNVHHEIYKNTKGDPLHCLSIVDLLVSAGLIGVKAKSSHSNLVPQEVVKTESKVLEIAATPLREAVVFSLENLLSADALVAMKTLAASGGRVRNAQAHLLVARSLAMRDWETQEIHAETQYAGVFRKEFVSNLEIGVCDGVSNQRGFQKHPNPLVVDPRAASLVYGASARATRASVAITTLVKHGVLQLDWGSFTDARGASENAYAEAAVAFAVADVPFPLDTWEKSNTLPPRDSFGSGSAVFDRNDSANSRGGSLDLEARASGAYAVHSGAGAGARRSDSNRSATRSETKISSAVSSSSLGTARHGVSNDGSRTENGSNHRDPHRSAAASSATARVPWLVFANDSVRRFAYETQTNAQRRTNHLDATRCLRDEAAYSVGDCVADVALLTELAAQHLLLAQIVDKEILAQLASAGRGGGSLWAATPNSTAAVTARRGSFDTLSKLDTNNVTPREILLAASGHWQRVRFHEDICAAHIARGTIRAAAVAATALPAAARAMDEFANYAFRIFGKKHPKLVARVSQSNEDGKAMLVRDAGWSLTLSRLVFELGDGEAPFLTGGSVTANHPGSPLFHLRRCFTCLDLKWPFQDFGTRGHGGVGADVFCGADVTGLLPLSFLRVKLVDGSLDELTEYFNDSRGAVTPAISGPKTGFGCWGGGFGGRPAASTKTTATGGTGGTGGAPGLEQALRKSVAFLFRRELDVASGLMDSRVREAGRPGSLVQNDVGGTAGETQDTAEPQNGPAASAHGLFITKLTREIIPLGEQKPGMGDILRYVSQIKPGGESSPDTRRFASREIALAACADISLASVFCGRPVVSVAAVMRHARVFIAAQDSVTPSDCALFLNLCAAVMPEGGEVRFPSRFPNQRPRFDAPLFRIYCALLVTRSGVLAGHRPNIAQYVKTEETDPFRSRNSKRAFALRRSEEILDAQAVQLRRNLEWFDSALPVNPSSTTGFNWNSFTDNNTVTDVLNPQKLKRALSGTKTRFAETPPAPRSGPALCARAAAMCARGDWVGARHAAGDAAFLLERPGESDLRLADMARVWGAVAEMHLGRWESALACVESLAHDRTAHCEIGPVVLAVRIAGKTSQGEYGNAAALWREASRKAPFAEPLFGLGTGDHGEHANASPEGGDVCGEFVSGGNTHDVNDANARRLRMKPTSRLSDTVDGRSYPTHVCCRAFAAQALWACGERVEACVLLELVLGHQLQQLGEPGHPLLPAAALAAGETAARACRVGAFGKKKGRFLLTEAHAFLHEKAPNVLPFASSLAARLREVAPAGFL